MASISMRMEELKYYYYYEFVMVTTNIHFALDFLVRVMFLCLFRMACELL